MIKGLWAHLTTDAGLSALVGTRVYPSKKAPQKTTLPYITYATTSTQHTTHLSGSSRLRFTRVEFSVYGATYDQAKQTANALFAAIGEDGYSGTWDGKHVHVARWDEEIDNYHAPIFDDDGGIHEITLDLNVRWRP